MPACREIAKVMFGKKAAEEITKVPLSDITIRRNIEIFLNIEKEAVKNTVQSHFAVQIDEFTDINGKVY